MEYVVENNLSGLKRADFQKEINGKKTDLFILKNKCGNEVALTNYGGAILSIMMPDKEGKYANVILVIDRMFRGDEMLEMKRKLEENGHNVILGICLCQEVP